MDAILHLVYKTTSLLDGKYYIGVHSTVDIDDGYMGSGIILRNAIKKHGVKNFSREILFSFETRLDLLKKEAELVNDELLKDPLCYNLIAGGGGCPTLSTTFPRKAKKYYVREARPVQVKERFRVNDQIKYEFKPNPKGMDWLKGTIDHTVSLNKGSWISRYLGDFIIDKWPSALEALTTEYNYTDSHKKAKEYLCKFMDRGLGRCMLMQETTWERVGH